MKNLITLLLLVVSTISFAQESTYLRFNYNTGDKYLMNMVMTQDMGEIMKMDMQMEMQTEVKEAIDTIFNTEMSFKSIKMDMSQAGNKLSYDSDTKEENLDDEGKMMSAQMKPILETILAVKTNAYGEVLEMKMIEGNAANADQFTNQTQSVIYPKEAVKLGSSWSDEKENNGMLISYTYTVKSIDAKSVILDVNGSVSGVATGTLTGSMNIDKASGISNTSNVTMDVDVMGQKMTTEVVISMTKVQ
ncbi:DUF6263 family protein [Hanstruepera marina]|uniref:DUF6263 family protein n=1 Tax=Hanstruepera marina TaxID=2873265 RepID=UPI001CA70797|nr:DUF6263 family protein [Hanstruepera marina]